MRPENRARKINILKSRTSQALSAYKCRLNLLTKNNKHVVANFKDKFLTDLVVGYNKYAVFIEIFLSTNNDRLTGFFNELRKESVSYFFVTQSELQTMRNTQFCSTLKLSEISSGSSLLVIVTDNETTYRAAIAFFIESEKETARSAFNVIRLLQVKDELSLISFAQNQAARVLYDSKNTQHTILLETLSLINSVLFMIPSTLQTPVVALRVAPVENFLVHFPFKN